MATTGYPTYYFQWAEVEKGVYAWDGSLLSNTPLREAIDASPVNDKRIFLVENYPKNTDKPPDNISHRFIALSRVQNVKIICSTIAH